MKFCEAVVGKKVGRLKILSIVSKNGKRYAECECECNTIKLILVAHLGSPTLSCGCLRAERDKTYQAKKDIDESNVHERFWNFVYPYNENGCRIWGGNASNGHGRFRLRKADNTPFESSEVSAHLIAWWLIYRTRESFIDRTCGNTLCVAPEHLEVRTKESRFWKEVDKLSTPEGCWPWKGGRHTGGYGSTSWGPAHRVAYELAKGPIPKGLVVRHMCHTPICCRPDHLEIGTQHDNIMDTVKAGRHTPVRGERSGLAKFTNAQAEEIRKVYESLKAVHGQIEAVAMLSKLMDASTRCIRRLIAKHSY